MADLVGAALHEKKGSARYAYVAPLYSQAKDVAWMYVKRLTEDIPGTKLFEYELRADLPNGNRVRLYGADNPDRLRGLYLDGVVLDEFADMKPSVWGEVIRPMLMDRKGWAAFIGTPKGRNTFYDIWAQAQDDPEWFSLMLKASESGLLDQQEIEAARRMLSPEQFEQELECSFDVAVLGAYWGKELALAEREGRIGNVPYEPELVTHTAWDLGIGDSTAIWFFQVCGSEVRVIDYYENHGHGLAHYAAVLNSKPYRYGDDWLPHDARVRELGTGRTRVETLVGLGLKPRIVPDHKLMDGINAVRVTMPQLWFDRAKCGNGVEALRQYQAEYDERARTFRDTPKHDWCFTGDTKVLTRHGIRQIMSLDSTGELLTPCGWKTYLNPRVTRRNAQLVEVVFSDGFTARCTPDHLFLTESGWKSAECLLPNTSIQSSLIRSRNISMAASTVFGPMKRILRGAVTSFTGTFGAALSGKYRAAVTSITLMETPVTIGLPTSNACLQRSTFPGLGATREAVAQNTFQRWLGKRPRNGTSQTPGDFGTSGTQSALRTGPSGLERPSLARIAARSLKRLFARAGMARNFAIRTARPLTIESVRPLAKSEDVWCMTVPDAECFSLANGAVVHNCSHPADALRYLCMAYREIKPKPKEEKQVYLGMPTLGQLTAEHDRRMRQRSGRIQ